jgi:NADH:ubiquinone oxidoreductase subunit 5 (subunit L)/multisubunit Na+/H+ antiporter MnhA subunit
MHAMAGELDLRKMSGLKRVLPLTNIFILVGCLALSGFPLFSGFFSKDDIVAATITRAPIIGVILLVTAFLTAYYTFRLYFRVFEGPLVIPPPPADAHGHADLGHEDPGHAPHKHHNHEPLVMMIPLFLLAIGAIFVGYINWPTAHLAEYLGTSPSIRGTYRMIASDHIALPEQFGEVEDVAGQEAPFTLLMGISAVISISGILLAYMLHLRDRARGDRLPETFAPVSRLLEAKYWIDEIYQALIVEPLRLIGYWFYAFDRFIVDGIVNLIGFIPQLGGFVLKLSMQRGFLQGYAASMLFGVAIILIVIFAS